MVTNDFVQNQYPEIAACFIDWSQFLDSTIEFQIESNLHGREHSRRVLLYSLLLADDFALKPSDRKRLAIAAVFHDSRRWDDGFDVGHGQRAAEYYQEYCKNNTIEVDPIITTIIAYHDQADEKGEAQFNSDEALRLFHIFKDADGLDRFRLGKNALDINFLRTKKALNYINLSKKLNQ
jgi:HD superfamily phosphodiesterase